MNAPGVISGIRVTHKSASVTELGAAGSGDQRADIDALTAADVVEEAFVLRTCNRAEAYVVTTEPSAGRAVLEEFVAGVPADPVVEMDHEESLRHLMRVAAGLESMILGEDRILGQFREAYEQARGAGGIGPVLEEGLTKAIHVGERVRTETAINDGVVSLASAAVIFLDDRVDLRTTTAAVVGAGDIGAAVAEGLASRGVDRLVVANRTIPNAEAVAETVDVPASGVGLADLSAVVGPADVVVSATGSSDPIIDETILADAGETLVVDMGQPRDVAHTVETADGVELYDLDALEAITDDTRERRRAAADRAAEVIDNEFDHLLNQYKRKRADEVIAAMHESAQRLKTRQVETALSTLEAKGDLTQEQRETVESLADSLVGQLLAAPTRSLRDAAAEDDWTTIATALQLFDPDFEADRDSFLAEIDRAEAPGDTGTPSSSTASGEDT